MQVGIHSFKGMLEGPFSMLEKKIKKKYTKPKQNPTIPDQAYKQKCAAVQSHTIAKQLHVYLIYSISCAINCRLWASLK